MFDELSDHLEQYIGNSNGHPVKLETLTDKPIDQPTTSKDIEIYVDGDDLPSTYEHNTENDNDPETWDVSVILLPESDEDNTNLDPPIDNDANDRLFLRLANKLIDGSPDFQEDDEE